MPFFLYQVRRVNDDDAYEFEAGFWAPTQPEALSHLHETVWDMAEKVVQHLHDDHGADNAEASSDDPSTVLITFHLPGDPPAQIRAETWTIGAAPEICETPTELNQARSDRETLDVTPFPQVSA